MSELTQKDWEILAQKTTIPTQAFINGKSCDAKSGKTFACINPATDASLGDIAACDQADVDLAVSSGRRAFEKGDWSRADPKHRKSVLLKLSELILKNAQELAILESQDMGKVAHEALAIDVGGSAAFFQWYAEAIDKLYDEIAPTGSGNLAMVTKEPLGVIGAVVPWNFPLDMATWKCAPALAAGNSIVLKPAEQSPLTALRLAELAIEAGLPEGVLNVVPGFGETAGKAIGLHNDIDAVAFTGSTAIGKLFMQYSGQSNLKQIWPECGGKSPNLIFPDCDDLDTAADMAAFGIFFNQGEICSANSRLLVHKDIKDEMITRLVERAKGRQPGNPLSPDSLMGAMVDAEHTSRVMKHVNQAKKDADLIVGGEQVKIDDKGCYIQPTIFDNASENAAINREEIFGPVLSVTSFETEEDAIRIANDTPYGLAASVWTNNLNRAHRVADALMAGTVSVNTVDALSAETPFGGFKQSGFGRDLSLHSLDKYTALKTTWIKY